jgi:thioesterase domain-containing protein/non-ribosomal peptide synthetase component F
MECAMQEVRHSTEVLFELPASTAQQYIYAHAGENAAAWNVAVRFRLWGVLNMPHLETAIQQVVVQHEILRTGFATDGGSVVQRVFAPSLLPLKSFDLNGHDAESEEVARISSEEARRAFDLSTPPLLRAALIRIAPEEHILLLTSHHLVCDGWSVGILTGEIMKAYAAVCANEPAEQDEDALQYADYAVAENEFRETDAYRAHAAFWKDELRSFNFAAMEERQQCDTAGEAKIYSRLLPVTLTRAVEGLARREGITFFEAALSAFALAQMKRLGVAKAAFVTPVSGRTSLETENMLGTFVNYLPVRLTADADETLGAFRHTVGQRMTELLTHADYRTEDLLQDSAEVLSPVFDSVFICQKDFVHTVEAGGVGLSAIPSVSPGALHRMTFFMVERTDGWRVSCEIDPTSYTAADAEEMLDLFEEILEAFIGEPGMLVGKFTGLRNKNLQAAPSGRTEAPASEAQQRYWMLQEIHEKENALRVRLQIRGEFDEGIAQEAFQALVDRHESLRTTLFMRGETLRQRIHPLGTEPDFEMRCVENENAAEVAALLDAEDQYSFSEAKHSWLRVLILKTGPSEFNLAITIPHALGDGWSCGLLQREFYAIYKSLRAGTAPALEPLALQYADFAEHEAQWLEDGTIQSRLEWWREHLPSRLPALNTPADLALAQKCEVEIEYFTLDPMVAATARRFARDENVTLFTLYGAALQALLLGYTYQQDISIITPFANRAAESEGVIGPFATPVLLHCRLQPEWNFHQLLASFQSHSMDAFENAAPLELSTEETLLQSRLGRHALNQISFFFQNAFVREIKDDCFIATPMAMKAAESEFEWQIAVIDYGKHTQIEFRYDSRLWSSESIRLVTEHYQRLLSEAIFHPETPLAHFAIATDEEKLLKDTPGQLLPISRRALHLEESSQIQVATVSAPPPSEPHNDLERTLVAIWREVFRNPDIGIQDNFFDLGGHSLLLARIRARLQKVTKHHITVADIFAAPTVESLARRLESTPEQVNSRIIPLRAEGSQPPLFLISQSMVFRRMVECLHHDQPVFTVVMQDEDLRNGKHTSFEEIAASYVHFIRAMRPHGPYRLGGWCVSSWLAYEIAQQLHTAGEVVDLLLLVDGWAPGSWRRLGLARRFLAKSNYYIARTRRQFRTLIGLPFSGKRQFLSRKWILIRASLSRQLASLAYSMNLRVEIKIEEQTTFVDQVVYAASRKYEAKPSEFEALIFRSEEQPQGKFLPADLGWSELLQHPVCPIALPGNHREIFDEPGAKILVQKIAASLSFPCCE